MSILTDYTRSHGQATGNVPGHYADDGRRTFLG